MHLKTIDAREKTIIAQSGNHNSHVKWIAVAPARQTLDTPTKIENLSPIRGANHAAVTVALGMKWLQILVYQLLLYHLQSKLPLFELKKGGRSSSFFSQGQGPLSLWKGLVFWEVFWQPICQVLCLPWLAANLTTDDRC